MGEQSNLTKENVDDLEQHLKRMKETNPDLKYRFFEQEEVEDQDEQPSNKKIFQKLEAIERQLKEMKP